MRIKFLLAGWMLTLILSSCAPAATETQSVTPVATKIVSGESFTQVASNGIVTFTDPDGPITLEYPEGWLIAPVAGGSRIPTVYLLTSLDYIPNVSVRVPDGETVVMISTKTWNPKNDLVGFADQQTKDLVSSGSTIVSEEDVIGKNGKTAKYFVVDAPEGRIYLILTIAGDKYVVLSGRGDPAAIRAIGLSVR
jgi:hypothetical protein